MKIRKIVVLILASTLGFVNLATAEHESGLEIDNNSIATEATESEHETMSTTESKITGIVDSVDIRNHSLQIKKKSGGMITLVVRSDTQIHRNGMIVKLSALKKGDQVAVKNPS